jgi:hypothetical protein
MQMHNVQINAKYSRVHHALNRPRQVRRRRKAYDSPRKVGYEFFVAFVYYCAVLASGSTTAVGLPVRLPATDDRLWMDIAEELTASPRKLFKRILSAEAALKTTKVCPHMRHTDLIERL